jgi:O-methyltransferase domain/Dimerisation domain
MSQQNVLETPPRFKLTRLILSLWAPQSIHTAAALGIPDLLANGPRRSDELAQAAGAHPGALYRLMRALVVLELCTQTEDGAFALTPLGDFLRSDSPDSARSWALLMGGRYVWHGWECLVDCVRTGQPAPKLLGEKETFEAMASDPQSAAIFYQAMVEMTRQAAGALIEAYDFSGVHTLVDVGGGYGLLLAAILASYPEMSGKVFDLPHCQEGATRLLAERGVAGRAEFIAGSFFDSVPPGADAYILKSVIHDWDDEKSLTIFKNCRAAMSERTRRKGGARLLIIEPIVPDRMGSSSHDGVIVGSDLNMLVMAGGRERTESEFRSLLEAGGLRIARIVAAPPTAFGVIEALPN